MIRRRRHNVCCYEGVAIALAGCLLLGIVGCQTRRCVMNPPDRTIDAPAALAASLRERVTRALAEPDGAALIIREEELTALLRQAVEGPSVRDVAIHLTEEALYLQMTVGRGRRPIRAALVPVVVDGHLMVRESCLTAGEKALPRIVGAAIESAVTALATDAAWSLRVESVTLREGAVVVVAERRD